MTPREHGHLQVLNIVTADPNINRRRLAARLGVSNSSRSTGRPKIDLATSGGGSVGLPEPGAQRNKANDLLKALFKRGRVKTNRLHRGDRNKAALPLPSFRQRPRHQGT